MKKEFFFKRNLSDLKFKKLWKSVFVTIVFEKEKEEGKERMQFKFTFMNCTLYAYTNLTVFAFTHLRIQLLFTSCLNYNANNE